MNRVLMILAASLAVWAGGCHDQAQQVGAAQQASGVLNGGVLNGGVLNGGVLNGGVLNGGVLNGGVLNGGVLNGGVSSVASATGCRFGRCANGTPLPSPR